MILLPGLVSIIKLDEVKSRATAIVCILFMVITSSFFYFKSNYIDWTLSLKCAIGGIIGGIIIGIFAGIISGLFGARWWNDFSS